MEAILKALIQKTGPDLHNLVAIAVASDPSNWYYPWPIISSCKF